MLSISFFAVVGACLGTSRFFTKPTKTFDGFLKTNGQTIKDRNGSGKEVFLRGINLGSLFLIEPWLLGIDHMDRPAIEDEWSLRSALDARFGPSKRQLFLDRFYETFVQDFDLDYLKDLGVTVVRLPINYLLIQNEDGSWVKDRSGKIDFGRIDAVVRKFSQRGIYVLLDLHGAPGAQSPERHSGRKDFDKLFSRSPEGESYRQRTVEIWKAIALHYKNNPAIAGYDLINEPKEPLDDLSRNALWDLYDRIYKAIRSVDPDHIVMMEGAWGWVSLPDPAARGWKNVVYQFHVYDVLENKDPATQREFIAQKIYESKIKQEEYQIPVMIGEFTCLDHLSTWEYYLDSFNKAGWSWAMWTYKSRGSPATWGLWSAPGNTPALPRIKNDSFEVLLKKLSAYETRSYQLNRVLADMIRKYSGR